MGEMSWKTRGWGREGREGGVQGMSPSVRVRNVMLVYIPFSHNMSSPTNVSHHVGTFTLLRYLNTDYWVTSQILPPSEFIKAEIRAAKERSRENPRRGSVWVWLGMSESLGSRETPGATRTHLHALTHLTKSYLTQNLTKTWPKKTQFYSSSPSY